MPGCQLITYVILLNIDFCTLDSLTLGHVVLGVWRKILLLPLFTLLTWPAVLWWAPYSLPSARVGSLSGHCSRDLGGTGLPPKSFSSSSPWRRRPCCSGLPCWSSVSDKEELLFATKLGSQHKQKASLLKCCSRRPLFLFQNSRK